MQRIITQDMDSKNVSKDKKMIIEVDNWGWVGIILQVALSLINNIS